MKRTHLLKHSYYLKLYKLFNNRRDDRLKRMHYREVLQKQAEETAKVDRNLTGITEKEKELNKSILTKVSEDPLMMSRVMHRIRIGKTGESNGIGKP